MDFRSRNTELLSVKSLGFEELHLQGAGLALNHEKAIAI